MAVAVAAGVAVAVIMHVVVVAVAVPLAAAAVMAVVVRVAMVVPMAVAVAAATAAVVVVVLVAQGEQEQDVEGDANNRDDEHEAPVDWGGVEQPLHRLQHQRACQDAHNEHRDQCTDSLSAVVAKAEAHGGLLGHQIGAVGGDDKIEDV